MSSVLFRAATRVRMCAYEARYYGIFWDWDGVKTYSKAELAERQGLTLCESHGPGALLLPAFFFCVLFSLSTHACIRGLCKVFL